MGLVKTTNLDSTTLIGSASRVALSLHDQNATTSSSTGFSHMRPIHYNPVPIFLHGVGILEQEIIELPTASRALTTKFRIQSARCATRAEGLTSESSPCAVPITGGGVIS